jgi:hypothetical protein
MTPELFFGAAAAIVSSAGFLLKSVGEMRSEIQRTTAFHSRTEEQLNMVNYRLNGIEGRLTAFGGTVDDIRGYMMSNSDWQERKH